MSTWLKTLTAAVRRAPRPPADPGALARAQALAAQGRYREAIDLAVQENRRRRDPMLEYWLARWRHSAFDATVTYQGRPDWPPAVADLFPDVQGPPEIPAKDLTSERLTSAIFHHGGLIVRGLVQPDEAERLIEGIDRSQAAAAAGRAGAPLEETLPWHAPYPLDFNPELAATGRFGVGTAVQWTADSPRMMFDLIELFEKRGVIDVLSEHMGERPALSVTKFTLRRVPPAARTDWHQDGAFLGADIRTVNMWLSLSDCGEDAPGLDIVGRRLPGVVPSGSHGSLFDWSVGAEMVETAAEGAPIVSPVFAPGDVLFFDHLLLHRTGVRPGMTKDRWAVESWFFAPSTFPLDRGAVLI
jgi:hypothetical protein